MKRVRGTSLKEILRRMADGDPVAIKKYTRTKLLGAFVSVCLAIDFAHSKSVIHRDLKPANIMLGEFGEVYVLDWGIMKLVGEAEPGGGLSSSGPQDGSMQTTIGSAFGTPGYMAPEQLDGDVEAISVRTDVYALGAMLYEILTLRPLSAKGGAGTPTVPPELKAICDRAVAQVISDRWASAREMADAVDRYLEGDRDLAMRLKAADEHLEKAKQALVRAREGTSEHEERARALREAARAVALAPDHAEATRTVLRVLLEPPRSLPREAARELEEDWIGARRVSSKIAVLGAATTAMLLSFGIMMGVRDWRLLGLAFLLASLGGGLGVLGATGRPRGPRKYVVLSCWLGLLLILTRLFGPLVMVPTIAAGVLVPFLLNAYEGSRSIVIAGCLFLP